MPDGYKATLLLPKTEFPMRAELVTREPERLGKWKESDLYRKIQEARRDSPLFVFHDGPPFANGQVHMGTALNKILKDLLVKTRSMLGYRVPVIPGWDCHGLPIEYKVVKGNVNLPPAEIRTKCTEYALKFVELQKRDFIRLGIFADWDHPYLTLNPSYEAGIIRAFAGLVEKGLVYQSKRPVYWSTGALTALAEAEVEYVQRTDPSIYVKFAVVGQQGDLDGADAVIWTTTPWTLPANQAIAVHANAEYSLVRVQKDAREEKLLVATDRLEMFLQETGLVLVGKIGTYLGSALVGIKTQHPFLPRQSPIINGDLVTMDAGTGMVHIAPGHGKDDYVAGQQNHLLVLSPVNEHGKFTEDCGMPQWVGKYVFDANADIVSFLRDNGRLLAEHAYTHDYPHCWRSKTPIVLRAVEQFFIRIDEIRANAMRAISETAWIPAWGRNRISGTVETRPDWCISRQRVWGVPLPVFYNAKGEPVLSPEVARKVAGLVQERGTNLWFEKDDAWWAEQVGLPAGTTRRQDTLDVWIDSGVSHDVVLRHHPELQFPADVYLEATDQHRGWFQSSLLTSVALNNCAPYKLVITHGFVVDKDTKRKLSKSQQGTYQKPVDADHFTNKFGADIVRLWAASVQYTDDVPFSEQSFTRTSEAYRNFRNVLRILLANLHNFEPSKASLAGATTIDRWVLSRLQGVIATARTAYEQYDFRRVFESLIQFCTVDLSSIYVDITKDRMYCDAADSPRRRATQAVMHTSFEAMVKLLAPILAFTADEAWEFSGRSGSVHVEVLPEADFKLRDANLEQEVEEWLKLRSIVMQAVEPARQAKTLAKSLEASVTLEVPEAQRAALEAKRGELEEFLITSDLTFVTGGELKASVKRSSSLSCARCWRYLPTVGTIPAHPDLCDRCAPVVG